MDLIVWRHAEAHEAEPGEDDMQRALTPRGRKQAERMAACLKDPRDPGQITHALADIIRFRLLMIAAGYEDGNDANTLRSDPMFKMALDLAPSECKIARNFDPTPKVFQCIDLVAKDWN